MRAIDASLRNVRLIWDCDIESTYRTGNPLSRQKYHNMGGLGSAGGYLHRPHAALESATADAEWIFALVGTVQTVLGPILLFLVLLTLRNRFRLG